MKKFKNKKTIYTIIGIVFVLIVTIGLTYAYWLITKKQTNRNLVTTKCLDIAISGEKNDIELTNQFPISDEDGMKLVPYEFTVTNNCNTSMDYQVALEVTGDESSSIASTSLKVALNNSVKLYSAYPSVETTISGAYESRKLIYGTLASAGNEESSASYSLRIWIDEDAPISEMNKIFRSKISVTVGKSIINPYKEGTLAYDILANYGGINNITVMPDATKYDHRIISRGDSYVSTSSSCYYGTEYTFDETTKKYTLSGTLTQATLGECRSGTKTCGKYTLKNLYSSYNYTTLYEVIDFQSSGNYVTANTIKYTTGFEVVTTPSDNNIYKTEDDLGDSYYYRGNPTNNYVQFGSYAANSEVNGTTYAEENLMYWRIVRINGDGSIRLAYDGIEKIANGVAHTATIGKIAYNENYDNAKYVGYTYDNGTGTQVDSTIKEFVDAWYNINLKNKYGKYIADTIFCNDKSTATNDGANILDKIPTLKCANKSDRYTVNDTINGNGYLINPVGLLTLDEWIFSGLTPNTIVQQYGNYLYFGEPLWTLTPYAYTNNTVTVYYIASNYIPLGVSVNINYQVRPVINLKADVEFTGNGTIDDPYVIVTE